MTSYACVIVGDEILAGKVRESNLVYAINTLNAKGYTLAEVRMVRDDIEQISSALTSLKASYGFVISFGGVGPTHDDITMKAYAHCFGKALIRNEVMYTWLMQKPRASKSEKAAVDYMSTLPEGIELIQPDNKWPIFKIENCFAFPGLPSIFRKTLDSFAQLIPTEQGEYYAALFVNEREGDFSLLLATYAKAHPQLKLGSYPIESGMEDDGFLQEHRYCTRIAITAQSETECSDSLHTLKKKFTARGTLIKTLIETHGVANARILDVDATTIRTDTLQK